MMIHKNVDEKTPESLARTLVSIIKEVFPVENDQLLVANKILGLIAVDTDIQKLHCGGLAELEACQMLNLKWIGDSNKGADAIDDHGRQVEIKTFMIKKTAKKIACNINYLYPANVDTVEHYAKSEKYAGGHYWVAVNYNKTVVLWTVHISQSKFAKLIQERLKDNPKEKSVNFGSNVCKKCFRCKRVDKIAGIPHTCANK